MCGIEGMLAYLCITDKEVANKDTTNGPDSPIPIKGYDFTRYLKVGRLKISKKMEEGYCSHIGYINYRLVDKISPVKIDRHTAMSIFYGFLDANYKKVIAITQKRKVLEEIEADSNGLLKIEDNRILFCKQSLEAEGIIFNAVGTHYSDKIANKRYEKLCDKYGHKFSAIKRWDTSYQPDPSIYSGYSLAFFLTLCENDSKDRTKSCTRSEGTSKTDSDAWIYCHHKN